MSERIGRIFRERATRQHGVVAVWQLISLGFRRPQIDWWLRDARPPKVHRGVYGVPDEPFGRYMAAALALGPAAAIAQISGVRLWGMRDPDSEEAIHVAVPGRGGRERRDGMVVHRPERVVRVHRHGIPVTTPTLCLKEAALQAHELYRALEAADRLWLSVDPLALPGPAASLRRRISGVTRSDAEARFVLLCHDERLPLPLVNHRLNGILTDFHWPDRRVVLEVDGFEFHKDRPQFEEDRRRGLVHRAAGYEVIRVSALQVQNTPELVVAALRDVL